MYSSKLFSLLRGLRHEEIHWFQKFLNSPFFNNNDLPIQLFDYLKKYHPELDSTKLTKEKIFQRIFPNEKFNQQKLRKAMHELTTLVEEFFVTIRVRNAEFEKKKLLVEELGERNLYPQFEKRTKALIHELEALPYRDAFFYKSIFELNYGYANHSETNRQKFNSQILKSSTESLDAYYLLQKQQLEIGIKSQQKLFNQKVKFQSLKSIKAELQESPVFVLYEKVIQSIEQQDNSSTYLQLERLFKEHHDVLSKNDQIIIFRVLLNYSIRQVNKGNAEYFKKIFLLYKYGLESKLLISNERITETIFLNIIVSGGNVGEFDWVENFIEAHQKYLPKTRREHVALYGQGVFLYKKKDYAKAIEIISNHTFSRPLRILNSKTILLRSYFGLYRNDSSYYDMLVAQVNAFEKFIRRGSTVADDTKEQYLRFVYFFRKIVNADWQNVLDMTLHEKIKNQEAVVLKFWLLETIDNILKN